MQDNNQMDFFGSYSYDQQPPQSPKKKKRFGWGSLLCTAVVCFVLGALTAALLFPLISSGAISLPGITPSEKSTAEPAATPAATVLPDESAAPETSSDPEAAVPTPTPYRAEIELPQLGSTTAPEISADNIVEDIAEKVGPSIVSVTAKVYVYSSATNRNLEEDSSSGSGIILTEDGYVVTNNHIIEDADTVYITVEGEEYPAEVIGTDATVDLAVLKADVTGLTPAALGDSTTVRAGQLAVAIGNPLGTLSGTITQGIVSAVNREVNTDGRVQVYIQTDAALNPGNSGGALIDKNGYVIGICSLKTVVASYDEYGNAISAEGLGYAIPISDALPVIEQLIQYGYVPRPGLGIMAYGMTDTDAEEWSAPKGVLVTTVKVGGPAEEAGLQVDDIIIGVDGTEVDNFSDMTALVKAKNVGDEIVLRVWRSGEEMDITVVIGDMNQIEATEKALLEQSESDSDGSN